MPLYNILAGNVLGIINRNLSKNEKLIFRVLCLHCVKIVLIRCFSGPHFPGFRLNKERYGVSLRIQSECGKIRTRYSPNKDTFHKVLVTVRLTVV